MHVYVYLNLSLSLALLSLCIQARVKAELDKKVLSDQIRALKKHNAQLAVRSREEVKAKLKEHEERKAAQEKVRDTGLCCVCVFEQYP